MCIDVEKIMKDIREHIADTGMNSTQLGYATPYFKGFAETLKGREQIVIMGMGENGQRLYDICMELRLGTVVAVCDNNTLIQGSNYRGRIIVSPDQAVAKYPKALYVATSQTAVNHMVAQLVGLGVSGYDIDFFNVSRTGLV